VNTGDKNNTWTF